ncbi:RDD family protein [Bacillus solimangrovi]|uniref:RDD domain-containing protein n=1 Tax=Bacillus solimangrovi TaxID=1305675 RepID=A0A1E5LEE7_9BACI|nr:RDD family protein [Bacillus solimangrovi]OEH92449.1 hypothetical protein BFG57_15825 [Bacillus solimangrovi]
MELRPANYIFRFFAAILDNILMLVTISLPLSYFFGKSDAGEFLYLTITNIYLIVVPVMWNGYLIGKKLTGMRVVKLNGDKVSISTMIVRQIGGGFLYIISFGILFIVSFFMVILRKDHRAIHDIIAGTIVIEDKK